MKTIAIIQARMGSKRLRAKSLMPIAGKALLSRVYENIQAMDFIDEIVIATTTLLADDPLVASAASYPAKVFRGSAVNLLDRFYQASLDMDENDTIMRITADNPFINIEVTRKLYDLHVAENRDYSHVENLSHVVAEFIRVGALREVMQKNSVDDFDREHVTPYFRRPRSLFNVLSVPQDYCGIRHDLDKYLTVDTLHELETIERIIIDNMVDEIGLNFSTIYEWLDENIEPESERE